MRSIVARDGIACYIKRMDIFYGYRRRPEDAPESCGKRVFIDADGTDREERAALLVAAQDGDTVIALARGDFGKGAEAQHIIAAVEAKGATVDIRPPEKIAPQKPGPPPKFQPNPSQDRQIKFRYHGGLTAKSVLEAAEKIYGQPVPMHQLKRRYGARWKG